MKLYNLFEQIILEEVATARLLTENVSDQDVIAAIDGKYNVNILYDDYPERTPAVAPSKRYIQVYDLGYTKGGNKAISAYQIFGGSKTTPRTGAWKIFRLDRIRGWYPTKVRFKQPVSNLSPNIPNFNPNGNNAFSSLIKKVNFNTNGTNTTTSRPQQT